jgi:hypothetical protein
VIVLFHLTHEMSGIPPWPVHSHARKGNGDIHRYPPRFVAGEKLGCRRCSVDPAAAQPSIINKSEPFHIESVYEFGTELTWWRQ